MKMTQIKFDEVAERLEDEMNATGLRDFCDLLFSEYNTLAGELTAQLAIVEDDLELEQEAEKSDNLTIDEGTDY